MDSNENSKSNEQSSKRPICDDEHIDEIKKIEEKQKKIEQQTIYYPHQEQVDLATFAEDVEDIDLSLSRIRRIDNFSRFKNLKSICFRSNLLKTLIDENFRVENGLASLEELDFYDNQLEKIENLNQFTNLKSLDLSFNRFKKIENLQQLGNLCKLFLVHNQISKIENLDSFSKLELLELGDNQLRTIDNLNNLINLKQL